MHICRWQFAQVEGARYAIYRVGGVGGDGPINLRSIANPYLQWRGQRVGICLAL
jgi:hypothetical protein